jgi:hypothetical protein
MLKETIVAHFIALCWYSREETEQNHGNFNLDSQYIHRKVQQECLWTSSIILFLFKTHDFGDWILSPSSDPEMGTNWVGFTWRRKHNLVSETSCYK